MARVVSVVVIKARSEQTCQLCGATIKPGEYYHRFNITRNTIKVCQKKHPIKVKAEAVLRDE